MFQGENMTMAILHIIESKKRQKKYNILVNVVIICLTFELV